MSGERRFPGIPEAVTVVDPRPGPPQPAAAEPKTPSSAEPLPSIAVPPHAARVLDAQRVESPAPPREDEDTAPRIGGYALIARFPSSHIAEVFLGYKVSTFGFIRRAVVKWTDRRRPDYERVRQNLLDEARAISFVDHPNIVTILDLADDESGTHLALEYVAGTDLRRIASELARRGSRLPASFACLVVVEVLRGLAHVHAARGPDGRPLRIIHRDVNPSNVLVSEDGHIKLTDFGAVHMTGRVQDTTAPGTVKGKVRYLAPEYISEQICTAQVDVYSAGVMLFELLSGAPVFSGPSTAASMMRIVRDGLPYEELEAKGIAPDLLELVRRATERDPERRYASAGAMGDALEDWMEQAGLFVSPSRFSAHLHREGLFV